MKTPFVMMPKRRGDVLALSLLSGLGFVGLGIALWLGEWFIAAVFTIIVGIAGFSLAVRLVPWVVTLRRGSSRCFTRRVRRTLTAGVILAAELLCLLAIWGVFAFELVDIRLDWTRARVYSLSSRSTELLAGLSEPVTVLFFAFPGEGAELDALLQNYAAASSKFSYRFVDFGRERVWARQYNVTQETTLIFYKDAAPKQTLRAYREDLLPLGAAPRKLGAAASAVTRIDNYEGVINASVLALLTQETVKPKLYFMAADPQWNRLASSDAAGLLLFKTKLERLGLRVAVLPQEILSSGGGGAAAADNNNSLILRAQDVLLLSEDVLLALAKVSRTAFSASTGIIARHLQRGGGVLLRANAQQTPPAQLAARAEALAELYKLMGMRAVAGIVMDGERFHPILGQQLHEARGLLVSDFPFLSYTAPAAKHAMTELLHDVKLTPFLPTPQALVPLEPSGAEAAVVHWQRTPLLSSAAGAWLEQTYFAEVAEHGKPRYHAGTDLPGAQVVAWALQQSITSARVVYLGSSICFENEFIGLFGNSDFLVNAVLWAAGQDKLLGSEYRFSEKTLFLPSRRAALWFLILCVCALPLAIILSGLLVAYKRRQRASLVGIAGNKH